jgi:hypothetical protein
VNFFDEQVVDVKRILFQLHQDFEVVVVDKEKDLLEVKLHQQYLLDV